MRNFLNKYPVVKYVIGSYVKFFLFSLAGFTVVFGILIFTGVYTNLESALDLKYNSPLVIIPLFGFIGLFVVCFFIGFLMYFYKYKRSKTRGTFYKAFSNILNEEPIAKR